MKFSDVTPNLIVKDIDRSVAFYRDVLGLSVFATVPEAAPYVFAWMQRDGVNVFLNTVAAVREEHAELGSRPLGGTSTLYIVLQADTLGDGIDALFASIGGRARVMMDPKNQFYGMREFGIEDPDGYVVFFAQEMPK
jgi:uncharacterized glyoxalase superfamily protein PhnB